MKIYHIPVLLIGIFLTLIGLEVLLAPDAIVVTPAHAIAFDAFGRTPLGLTLTVSGAATFYEGLKGSRHMYGLFLGILNSIFWFIVTLLPLFYGEMPTTIFGFQVKGSINGVSVAAWLLISSLSTYYYSRRTYYWHGKKNKELLDEIRSGR